ncbi:hypothetical protein ACR8AL_05305 [Clavibacter sepedonicus]|uniref:hypothetical protein n=1 Tax=Clavibacter TaxID=1573 RepID=UPI0013053ADA|nr:MULTISPECIES: hypothetical protein [Clavibacter]MBD5382942.1 hypothetical protein [Clavibacter sp.]UUK65522.1 hypothetical protein LRE50_14815 [Clavibacter sepedonicus]
MIGLLALLLGALAVVCFRAGSALGIIAGLLLLLVAVATALFAMLWLSIAASGGLRIPF